MMFPNAVLDGIVAGRIDLAYRRWTRRMHAPGCRHRIELCFAGEDVRVALRETTPDSDDLDHLADTLAAMDHRSRRGAWTSASCS